MDPVRLRKDALFEPVTLFQPFIDGIEVTQAVQYYEAASHLTDPADRGADNAVRLVSGKPAWVRVYVWAFFGELAVSATLEVQRRSIGYVWNSVTTLNADPSSATSVPPALTTTYAAVRGALPSTLNFVIPASEMIGTLRLIARVNVGVGQQTTLESTVDVAVTLRQTLQFAGIMISYNGPASAAPGAPNLTIAAPTLANLQSMAGTTLTLFPVQSTAAFRTAGTLALTNHLLDTSFPTSGCGVAWDTLFGRVASARTADGNQPGWIYYGLLPGGVPMGPVGGCGGGGVAVGPVNQPGTLAHEAGHACGLGHAPAGGAPNPDPSYPAYEPYDPANTPQGSTGEFGLNVNNGNLASPQTFRDFMSYAGPAWISLYHYGLLLSNAALNPTTVAMDHPWWIDLVREEIRRWPWIPEPDPPPFDLDLELPMFPPTLMQKVISLIVKVERGKVVDVMHVARTLAHMALAGAERTAFTARLLDAEGAVLAHGEVFRLDTMASGCGSGAGRHGKSDTYLAQVFVPDVASGDALEIVGEDSEVVWRRDAPAAPPHVTITDANFDRRSNLTVAWDASKGVTEFWLRWSRDGETWQTVATGLETHKFGLDVAGVPAGEGLLQVVAHDGFFSTASDPVRIALPDRAPEAVILHPVDGHTYTAGQTLRLWASFAEPRSEAGDNLVWTVDGKEVARGPDAWATLERGQRMISVRASNGQASASVTVMVLPAP